MKLTSCDTLAGSRNIRRKEAGYMLLALMLGVTLMMIAAAAAAPRIAFSIQRDREEEFIHRAEQYPRAIRRFYHKTGRYPNSLEELRTINGMRFLRKEYKDPLTQKEFRLVRFSDVQLSEGARTTIVTQSTPDPPAEKAATGGNKGTPAAATAAAPVQNPDAQGEPDSGSQGSADQNSTPDNSAEAVNSDAAASDLSTVVGQGPIVGVASRSKRHTIREFSHKSHYNEWQFYFDPGHDYGYGLNVLTGPTVTPAIPSPSASPGETPKGN